MGSCLVATLLAHATTAQALLTNKATGQERACEASGQPVGATLCLALIAAIPPEALAVPHSSDTGTPLGSDHQLLDGDTLVCVVALRNVVAHSTSAKPAAVRTGLHTALLNCCLGAAQCLETAQHDAAFANGGLSVWMQTLRRGHMPTRVRQAPPPSSAASSIGTPVRAGRAIGKASHQLRTPNRQSADSSAKGGDTGAPTAGTEAGVPTAALSRQQATAGAGVGAAGTCPLAQSPVFDRKVTVALSLLRHLALHSPQTKAVLLKAGLIQVLDQLWHHGFAGTSLASTSSSHHLARGSQAGVVTEWVGTGHPGSSGKASKATPPSERVRTSVSSHAFGGRPSAKTVASSAGHQASAHSVAKDSQHGAPCSAYPALHEVLGLLTNMVVGCEEARAAVCGEGCPTLLQRVLGLLFERKLETPTFCLITGLLGHLAAEADGTACLLRGGATGACSGGPGGEVFLSAIQRCVRDLVHALPGPSQAGGAALRPKDLPRILGLMQVLVNMAAHAEGARALLKGSHTAAGLLEVLLGPEGLLSDVGGQPKQQQGTQALQCASLLLLRNLCFCGDAKTHLLAHPRVLPVLLAHAECPTEAPKAAAIAASAIWTLTYQGEKVKSAIRRLPSALQRLTVARAAAHFHASKLAKTSQQQAAQLQALQAQAAQLQAVHLQEARQHALQLQAAALHPSAPPDLQMPPPTKATNGPVTAPTFMPGAAGPSASRHENMALAGASPDRHGSLVVDDGTQALRQATQGSRVPFPTAGTPLSASAAGIDGTGAAPSAAPADRMYMQQQPDSTAGEQLYWLKQAIEYYDAVQGAMDATSAATGAATAAGARASSPPPDQGSSMPALAASAAASAAATAAAEAALGFRTVPGGASDARGGVASLQQEDEGHATTKMRGVDRAEVDRVGVRDQDRDTPASGFVPPARKQLGW
ncbi:hypothetical protein DUNSADRAFT_9816 [Dunaliella salina]|uniref:Uncharacterized protein n=1 Tax=Dunaliella salina TaxID=3046 RepID=A0ABQ7GGN0_DUNSA|nr:hypothetical protein DUNSADRAFT_9816 [Dunaliella salina]|eukprot:KAF5833749.1 hypothetical protein DUNSADRAFT_9816 [Dunaliella salina]